MQRRKANKATQHSNTVSWHEFQVYGMRYGAVACVNRNLTDSCAQIPHIWDSNFTCPLQMRQ